MSKSINFDILGRLVFLTIQSLFIYTSTMNAATIQIDQLLTNPSFENPTTFDQSPTSWTTGGSPAPGVGVYAPTSSQYTPGADGLPGLSVVPNGQQVAFTPTIFSGSGSLAQSVSSTWTFGNTYNFTFWIGVPNTEPDGTTPVVGPPSGALQLYFTANGVQSSLPSFNLNAPAIGQWEQVTESFTPGSDDPYLGQQIGVLLFSSTGQLGNDQSVNFDIGLARAIPEPVSILLTGAGLLLVVAYIGMRNRLHQIT
jgi:hypothetical protein